jgi:hypothetical protein
MKRIIQRKRNTGDILSIAGSIILVIVFGIMFFRAIWQMIR